MRQVINTIRRLASSLTPVLALCFFLPVALDARELSEPEIRTAVETWVRHVTADARPNASIEMMEPYRVDGATLAYIAHLQDGGFCLCGADDLVLPVYWYSPQGKFDPAIPDFQYILGEISLLPAMLNALETENPTELAELQPALEERAEFWQDLIMRSVPTRRQLRRAGELKSDPDSMEIVFTPAWGQRSPYDLLCPQLPTTGYTCAVGCVATAMAQIMYHWRWPDVGTGTDLGFYEYRWRGNWDEEPLIVNPGINPTGWAVGRIEYDTLTAKLRMNGYWDHSMYLKAIKMSDSTGYRTALDTLWNRMDEDTTWLPADYGATTYDWSVMTDSASQLSPAGTTAVATLSYHAGIACHMNYHVFVSTTNNGNLIDALKDHFYYDSDGSVSEVDITQMTDEIQWLRPFAVGGSDTAGRGSHTWVVYGYSKSTDPDRQFKMNMGWDGVGDGWFCLDTVATGGCVFHTSEQTKYLAPSCAKFVGDDSPGDGSPNDPYQHIQGALSQAPDGAVLIFKAGSDNTFSSDSLVLDRRLTLKGKDVTIRRQ
jgi:hypothetical protein